jgi:hypothetical protein
MRSAVENALGAAVGVAAGRTGGMLDADTIDAEAPEP